MKKNASIEKQPTQTRRKPSLPKALDRIAQLRDERGQLEDEVKRLQWVIASHVNTIKERDATIANLAEASVRNARK